MKKLILTAALGVACFSAFAQGTLNFANFGGGIDVPVFLADGVTKVPGPKYAVTLLGGPSAYSLAYIAVTPFLTNAAGYFDGGIINIPTVAGGDVAFLRLEFLDNDLLHLYHVPEWPAPPLFIWGQSPVFTVVLGDANAQPATPPALLSGLGTAPLILGAPRLEIRRADTNTLTLSISNPPSPYVLSTLYLLEQNPTLNETNWITATDTLGGTLPRPDGNMFYRLVPQ